MKGGEFLGSGSYGCIFYPAIKCKDKTQLKGVGKVFSDVNERNTEYELGRRIRTIDKQGKYFNNMVNECDVDLYDLEYHKSDCPHVKENGFKYNQLVYKEKGIDLCDFLDNTETFNIFDKSNSHYILNLLKGVELLEKNKLVHLDIKPTNILVTDKDKLLLIDFGLMRSISLIYHEASDYLLLYNYPSYPPEFIVFKAFDEIKDGNISLKSSNYYDNLRKMIETIYHNNLKGTSGYNSNLTMARSVGIELDHIMEDFKVFLITLMERMKAKGLTHKSDLSQYFKDEFVHKADVFSVGYNILYMMVYQKGKTNNTTIFKTNGFVQLIQNTMCFNPYKRYTIKESIIEYKRLIKKDTGKSPDIVKPIPSPVVPKKHSFNSKDECMKKFKLPELKKMIDQLKLNKKLKQMNKENLCENLLLQIPKSPKSPKSPNVSQNNKKQTKEDCLKNYSVKELKKIVDDKELDKKIKRMKKNDICESILEHLPLKNSTNPKMTKEDCLKNYSVKELKNIVDDKELDKKIKRMNKENMCVNIIEHL